MNTELLEDSFAQIKPDAIAFSHSFYETLFRYHPDLKPLFVNTSQSAQEKKLIFSLAAIVDNLRSPEVLGPALRSLGARHVEVGTMQEHYPYVGQALIETLEKYVGSDWTPELAKAWTDAYDAIATTMQEGAKDPEAYLGPELTFYEWIDLYGEENSQLRQAIALLTQFHYGNQPKEEAVESST